MLESPLCEGGDSDAEMNESDEKAPDASEHEEAGNTGYVASTAVLDRKNTFSSRLVASSSKDAQAIIHRIECLVPISNTYQPLDDNDASALVDDSLEKQLHGFDERGVNTALNSAQAQFLRSTPTRKRDNWNLIASRMKPTNLYGNLGLTPIEIITVRHD